MSQDKGCRRDRTQTRAAGVQRDITDPAEADAQGPDHGHNPAENPVTHNAHSIEVDRYNIDDIDVLHTFHSVYRLKDGCQPEQ